MLFPNLLDPLMPRPLLDDNNLNVEAAKRLGITAVRVKGVSGAEEALVEAGVLTMSRTVAK